MRPIHNSVHRFIPKLPVSPRPPSSAIRYRILSIDNCKVLAVKDNTTISYSATRTEAGQTLPYEPPSLVRTTGSTSRRGRRGELRMERRRKLAKLVGACGQGRVRQRRPRERRPRRRSRQPRLRHAHAVERPDDRVGRRARLRRRRTDDAFLVIPRSRSQDVKKALDEVKRRAR